MAAAARAGCGMTPANRLRFIASDLTHGRADAAQQRKLACLLVEIANRLETPRQDTMRHSHALRTAARDMAADIDKLFALSPDARCKLRLHPLRLLAIADEIDGQPTGVVLSFTRERTPA